MRRALGVLTILVGLAIIATGGGVLWQRNVLLERASWTAYDGFVGSSGRISTSDGDDTVTVFWYARPRAEDLDAEPETADMRLGAESFRQIMFGDAGPRDQTIYVYRPTVGPTLACAERWFDECAERSGLPWWFALGFALAGAFVVWMGWDRVR